MHARPSRGRRPALGALVCGWLASRTTASAIVPSCDTSRLSPARNGWKRPTSCKPMHHLPLYAPNLTPAGPLISKCQTLHGSTKGEISVPAFLDLHRGYQNLSSERVVQLRPTTVGSNNSQLFGQTTTPPYSVGSHRDPTFATSKECLTCVFDHCRSSRRFSRWPYLWSGCSSNRRSPDGLRSAIYEFCIPARAELAAEVASIDPTIQISAANPGRIGVTRMQLSVPE